MAETNESQPASDDSHIPIAETVAQISNAGSEFSRKPEGLPVESEYHSEDGFYPLDARMIRVELIGGLIFTLVALAGLFIGLVIVWANVGMGWILGLVALGGVFLLGVSLYFTVFWPRKVYDHASWRLDSEGLEIRRGVLWRHQISIPLGRVQHADVSQGPLQRMHEIGKLTVHTAGTQNASVELDGLTHSVALDLRDLLVKQRRSSDVV